jgi:hypothetical protein
VFEGSTYFQTVGRSNGDGGELSVFTAVADGHGGARRYLIFAIFGLYLSCFCLPSVPGNCLLFKGLWTITIFIWRSGIAVRIRHYPVTVIAEN